MTGGGIATFTIDQLDFRDGQLTDSFFNEIGGQTQIDVHDATSDERLVRSADNPFTIDGHQRWIDHLRAHRGMIVAARLRPSSTASTVRVRDGRTLCG